MWFTHFTFYKYQSGTHSIKKQSSLAGSWVNPSSIKKPITKKLHRLYKI